MGSYLASASRADSDSLHGPAHQERTRRSALLPPLTEAHLWHTIKQMALKAPGLDGVGFDFLKALPYAAMTDLKALLQQIEEQAMIPSRWGASLIATLPNPVSLRGRLRLWPRCIRCGAAFFPPLGGLEKVANMASRPFSMS